MDPDRPPDGGWGWVVVLGACVMHFMLVGMARCLGVIYLCLRLKYHSSAASTAWVAAAFNTCRTLPGKFAAINTLFWHKPQCTGVFSLLEGRTKIGKTPVKFNYH